MLSLIYRNYYSNNLVIRTFAKSVRKILLKIGIDGSCKIEIFQKMMFIPFSHALPGYLSDYEHYDRLPERISNYMQSKLGEVHCIDIGANVGDSVAAFKKGLNNEKCSFIAIEPNSKFRNILHKNWGSDSTVEIMNYICSSKTGFEIVEFSNNYGTGKVSIGKAAEREIAEKMLISTIDDISKFKDFNNINLIKIDTDGSDFDVIVGAKKIINKNKPFLLFEVECFDKYSFDNKLIEIIEIFKEANYKNIFVYDNTGNFLGLYKSDISDISKLIQYLKHKKNYYYDFLLMESKYEEEFFHREIQYYEKYIK